MAIATPPIERPQLDVDFAAPASREALERAAASLSSHGFETVIVSDGQTARDFVLTQIPRGSEVHWGAGATVPAIGLADALERSSDVDALRPAVLGHGPSDPGRRDAAASGPSPDVFVNIANAVTEDGSIVSASASGSQLGPIARAPAGSSSSSAPRRSSRISPRPFVASRPTSSRWRTPVPSRCTASTRRSTRS